MTENWEQIWNEYHDVLKDNPGRLLRFDAISKNLHTEMKILDFGCGDGQLIEWLLSNNYDAYGWEPSRAGRDLASKRLAEKFPHRIFDNLPGVDFLEMQFDCIIISEVLEHLDNPVEVLQSIVDSAQLDCYFIITVPSGPISYFDRFIGHRKHYTRQTIENELSASGLEILRCRQIGFPLINLVRLFTLIRGKRFVEDLKAIKSRNSILVSLFSKCLFRVFKVVASFSTPLGWQLVLTARKRS